MASPSGRKSVALIDRLAAQPYDFEFFQAVRVWELDQAAQAASGTAARAVVGYDGPPRRETLRFGALPAHTFPPSEIAELKVVPQEDSPAPLRAEVTVSFLGLFGPAGVLPQHYTQLVIDRVRQKDFALRDFLDLFHHRIVSLFYRAWEKYRLPLAYERAARALPEPGEDAFTRSLFALVGLGTGNLRGRLQVPDAAFLYFSGHFAHAPRSAVALEGILGEAFGVCVHVAQFQGQWLYLRPEDQSRFATPTEPRGRNCRLGQNAVAGQRVWSVENRFRVRLGPLSYREFQRYLPSGDALAPICQLTRTYAGPEFDFDIQPVLRADQTPFCRLDSRSPAGPFLGWNSWLISRLPARDAEEAVFEHDGYPQIPPVRTESWPN